MRFQAPDRAPPVPTQSPGEGRQGGQHHAPGPLHPARGARGVQETPRGRERRSCPLTSPPHPQRMVSTRTRGFSLLTEVCCHCGVSLGTSGGWPGGPMSMAPHPPPLPSA